MTDCIFCKIIRKEIPARVLYEDERFLAFHDIHPKAPLHFLIIPKQHIASLADAKADDQAWLGDMLLLANRLAKEQGAATGEGENIQGGYQVRMHVGPSGGQEVYHLHLHVLANIHS